MSAHQPYCVTCGEPIRRITVGPGYVHISADINHAPMEDDETLRSDMEDD